MFWFLVVLILFSGSWVTVGQYDIDYGSVASPDPALTVLGVEVGLELALCDLLLSASTK